MPRVLALPILALFLLAHAAGADPAAHGFTERASTITVDGERIPVAIDLPAGGAPRGAVLIVPGAFNSDVDGNYPTQGYFPHTYADLARGLALAGYAALRYARDGEGTGTVVLDPALAAKHRAFAERAVVAQAALRALHDAAPSAPLAVAGHSEGATVAALLAAQDPNVRALVDLEAPGRPILTLFLAQVRTSVGHLQRSGAIAPPLASAEIALFEAMVSAIRSGATPPRSALVDPLVRRFLGKATGVEIDYLREEDRIDPAQAIARVRQPTLIVQGGADEVVFPRDAQLLQTARDRARLPTTLVMLAGDQHFYKRVPPGTTPFAAFHLAGATDPAVIAAVARWLDANLTE